MIQCNRDCNKCRQLNVRADDKGYPYGYDCMKYGDSVFKGEFESTKEFKEHIGNITRIKPGQKIFCEGERVCLKIEKELNKKGIETKIGCNEGGMWSVYIESVPWSDGEIETDFNHKESIYDGCGIIDFKII